MSSLVANKAASVYTRKLCSCNALLSLGSTDAVTAGSPAADTSLFGVILLNSPANTDEDFASYIRFFERYRGCVQSSANAGAATPASPAPVSEAVREHSPYFICADGAYAALKGYCARHYPTATMGGGGATAEERSSFMALRLCDALVGDMDSLSAAQLRRVASAAATGDVSAVRDAASAPDTTAAEEDKANAQSTDAAPLLHGTVDAIPVELLAMIQRRRDAYRRQHIPAAEAGAAVAEPLVVLPVTCQMTTDFQKGVSLLQRLWALDVGTADAATAFNDLPGCDQEVPFAQQSHEAGALAAAYAARIAETATTVAQQAGEDQQEVARCVALMEAVTPSAVTLCETGVRDGSSSSAAAAPAQNLETRVLPNVAVIGALGGRIDHEIGVMCCLLRYARVFHLMVINKHNVLFACWPDGVTQLVLPPSWSPPPPAPGATARPYMCGVVPFGVLREMETVGLRWNVVKNRPGTYDGYTQTEGYRFAFDGLVSACNVVTSPVLTIDVRPMNCASGGEAWSGRCSHDPDAPSINPPTLFTLGLPGAAAEFHADVTS